MKRCVGPAEWTACCGWRGVSRRTLTWIGGADSGAGAAGAGIDRVGLGCEDLRTETHHMLITAPQIAGGGPRAVGARGNASVAATGLACRPVYAKLNTAAFQRGPRRWVDARKTTRPTSADLLERRSKDNRRISQNREVAQRLSGYRTRYHRPRGAARASLSGITGSLCARG